MCELKAGFARVDITPPLGTTLAGYPRTRYADGVLDPLTASAVVFDNGEKRVVIMSVDHLGLNMGRTEVMRPEIAKAAETEADAIHICCTHTHLGPVTYVGSNEEYVQWMTKRMCDAAVLAVNDLAPATLSYTRGRVEDVAFVRRFRMKDGSCRTNPGPKNPDIDHPLGLPDEESSLLIIKREGAKEIGIVNFQVHPDVISGTKISADFPYFVRSTYEELVPNSHCMYINGTQGDTNHVDVRLGKDDAIPRGGYKRSRYMGRKIAMSVIANYDLALPLEGTEIDYAQKYVTVTYNKGKPEEYPAAKEIVDRFNEGGIEYALPDVKGMLRTSVYAQARRIVSLAEQPDTREIVLSGIRVGEVAFAGFPGEPFTEMGRGVKKNSKYALTIPSCATNGYEAYFPTEDAYEYGSYEGMTARFVCGTAEMLTKESYELINSLK